MHVKNIKKKAVIFTMAAVLGVAGGVSGVSGFLVADTPQVANAKVKTYNVTMDKGKTIHLGDIVPDNVLEKTSLKPIANSNKSVVTYTTIKKGKKLVDVEITGLKKGNSILSFFKDDSFGNKNPMAFYMVKVIVKNK